MKDNGGPAFPRTGEGVGNPNYDVPGMTMRQWYKGMALAGYSANVDYTSNTAREIAKMVSDTADAMIAEDREAEK